MDRSRHRPSAEAGFSRLAIVIIVAAVVAASVLAFLTLAVDRGSSVPAAMLRQRERVTLSIVGTNDLHGGVLGTGGQGGLALLAGYVDNVRAARDRDGGAVLLVDAGDMWQGTLESNLSEGASVVAAYNVLGYAAAALGNHEFDFGPVGPAATPLAPGDDPRGTLKARAAEARFPLLAANLIDDRTGAQATWPNVHPSIAFDAASVRVGIVGVLTAEALTQTIAANTAGLRLAPLAGAIEAEARRLREDGAAVVIVTAHAGGQCTRFDNPTELSSCDVESEIFRVARALPAGLVDVIVAGHVHEGLAHDVNGTAIVSAYAGGIAFGRVDLDVDRVTHRIAARRIFPPRHLCGRENPRTARCDPDDPARAEVPVRYEGRTVTADPEVIAVLAPAIERAAALKATTLGVVLDTPIARVPRLDSPLGNLFVDALRESVPGADVAVYNIRGGIRADLPAGPLTFGSVFSMIPFDNRIATFRLAGRDLKRVIAAQLQADPPRMGISGARVAAECRGGAVDVRLERYSGRSIGDDERLTVATTDFLAFGGNEILTPVMPSGGFPVAADAPVARDLIVEWFRRRGGHLRADQFVDAVNPRWRHPPLPMRCGG
jgi:5'-nucleotidase